MEFAFDPSSPGARRLARTWLPQLERWELRVPDRHHFIEGDGAVTDAGGTVDVAPSEGEQLLEQGYELLTVRRLRAGS